MNHLNFITTEEVDLTNCDREAIHIPGSIQPHGVLFVLQDPQLKILQASNNTQQFLGIPAQSLLNQDLSILFPPSQIEFLRACILQDNPEIFNPLRLSLEIDNKSLMFNGVIHRNDRVLILEVEPDLFLEKKPELSFYNLVKSSALKIKKAARLSETAKLIVKEVKRITGYDRVMIYRFEPDESGVVIAEDKQEKLESYLELHYPASDIPKQARKLYYENWLRLIVDMTYWPVEIIPANNPITGSPIDLSLSILRSVSPMHIEYSRNMGISASMCISLVNENRLWGLIVCHHCSPKHVDYETRKYCEFLGQLMSVDLVNKQKIEAEQYKNKVNFLKKKLRHNLLARKDIINEILEQNESSLLELVHAQGAVIYLGNELTRIGETPSKEVILDLINWLLSYYRQEVFFTNALSKLYPKAKEFKDQASGLLAISIFLNQTSYHILWFRPEVIHTVNWGRNPHDSVSVANEVTVRLSPRKSFELWKETVREKSLPWQQVEIDAAQELRNTLMLAALEFSQSALQEAARRAEVANRAKSQFLAKMSHELRTPLNAILGFTQVMARDKSLYPEQLENLGIINRSGEQLLSLINDVLEMSKIEAGRLSLHENSFDLYKMLDSIEEMVRLTASNKGLELIFVRMPEVPQYVSTDENKLRQVLLNLLENAIKFTTEGSVTLRVKAGMWNGKPGTRNWRLGTSRENTGMQGYTDALNWLAELSVSSSSQSPIPNSQKPNEATPQLLIPHSPLSITFEVEDTGSGIAADELDTIFEAFVQSESGRQSMQGTGLGLPITRQFVRLMGGDITVRSQLGRGTSFTFDILVRLANKSDVQTTSTSKRVIGLELNQPPYRLLVVEDVEENRRLLLKLLQVVGFEVRSASNGVEAIAVWQDWKPHLILMDMLMPVMDGYEATKQIKATLKGQATIIIALTAHAFSEERSGMLEAGCDDFVPKPFREDILLEKIAHHLGVRYVYEEPEQSTSPQLAENSEVITPEALAVMPEEWLAQLHRAAEGCNDEEILTLIEQIPEPHEALKLALADLVDNFRLDLIFDLTQGSTNE